MSTTTSSDVTALAGSDSVSVQVAKSSDMEAFRKVLSTAKRVVILSGAGLSAASGIPTYRGPNGLWTTSFDPSKLSTPQGFKEDPGRVWQFFHVRRQMMMDARPNAAHRAIARLADPAVRRRLMPCVDAAPLHVTQNIDGLYRVAVREMYGDGVSLGSHGTEEEGTTPKASFNLLDQIRGSRKQGSDSSNALTSQQDICATAEARIEMHGSAFKTMCTQCQHVRTNFGERVLSPALDGVTLQEVAAATDSSSPIPTSELPRCGGVGWTSGSNRYGRCGGLLRPAVVWFGEHPQALGELHSVLNWTDVLIVVGTSALVYPAAGFSKMVKMRGGTVAVFNLECTSEDDADFMFLGPCEETLARLVEGL